MINIKHFKCVGDCMSKLDNAKTFSQANVIT